MKLGQITGKAFAKPQIISRDSSGTIRIAFPGGAVYEYTTMDVLAVQDLERRYGRNMGQFVRHLDELAKSGGGIARVR